MCTYGCNKGGENGEREDDMVLCVEGEENLMTMVGYFVEMCRRKGLNVNADKSKVMVLGGVEGLEWEVLVNEMRWRTVSEFRHIGCVLDESGTHEAECLRKEAIRRKVAGGIRSLFNASKTVKWMKKERSRIMSIQMDSLTRLLGIKRMDMVSNARIRELRGVTKGLGERIDEGFLRWFGHEERMENDMIVRECM